MPLIHLRQQATCAELLRQRTKPNPHAQTLVKISGDAFLDAVFIPCKSLVVIFAQKQKYTHSKVQFYKSSRARFQQSFVISSVTWDINEAARLELYFSYSEAKERLMQNPFIAILFAYFFAKLMSDLRSAIAPSYVTCQSPKASRCYPANGRGTSVFVSVVSFKFYVISRCEKLELFSFHY